MGDAVLLKAYLRIRKSGIQVVKIRSADGLDQISEAQVTLPGHADLLSDQAVANKSEVRSKLNRARLPRSSWKEICGVAI